MEIKVLGPLSARLNGMPVAPTAGKPRQLLALLGLYAGQVVTVPTLIEELWGTVPPRSALGTLQTHVLRIRRVIEAATPGTSAKDVLVTTYGGYLLDIDRAGVDLTGYERGAAAGRRALEAGDPTEASALLGAALDVWRGPMLSDVRIGQHLEMEITRVEESRLGVWEARIEADMRLGRYRALLGELAMLTARYPLHVNFRAQYMLALHRCGQQWRALEEYRSLHDRMTRELGINAPERLRRLQLVILGAGPGDDPSDNTPSSPRLVS